MLFLRFAKVRTFEELGRQNHLRALRGRRAHVRDHALDILFTLATERALHGGDCDNFSHSGTCCVMQ